MPQFTEKMLELLKRVHINLPWKYLPRYVEQVVRFRVNVEIGFEGKELDRASRSELQTCADRLLAAGCRLTLHGPFWDLNPGSTDPLIRQVSRFRLQQFLDLLDVFHPVAAVCHSGFDPRHHEGHRQLWLERSLEAWEPLVRRAELLGIPLLLENVWEYDPHLLRELLERIDSPFFGFCLDVGHQHSFSKTGLSTWLEVLGDLLKEIHLHDNDGATDAHLPVGKGNIDFGLLFGFLSAAGKSPVLTLEPHQEEHVSESLEGLLMLMDEGVLIGNSRMGMC